MRVLVLIFGLLVVANGRVYSPCELVQSVKDYWEYMEFETEDFEKSVPLVVCIAGYRNFNTSHKVIQPNGKGYHGIFGIHDNDVAQCNNLLERLSDDNISDDLYCLKKVVLKSPETVNFYRGLCVGDLVEVVSCPINSYVAWKMPVPRYPAIFDNNFGNITGVPTEISLPDETSRHW